MQNPPTQAELPIVVGGYGARGGGLAGVMAMAARMQSGAGRSTHAGTRVGVHAGGISAYIATDRGLRRIHNEDAYLIDSSRQLYLLADGMGGALGGEVASEMAVQGVHRALLNRAMSPWSKAGYVAPAEHPLIGALAEAAQVANLEIFRRASVDTSLRGMGTTLTGLSFDAGFAFLVHVGDSRAYRVRSGAVEQLSEDHTYGNELLKDPTVCPDVVERLTNKNVLVRAVGVEAQVEPDVFGFATQVGDRFILCSDGLSNVVQPQEMLAVLEHSGAEAAPEHLVALANHRGGPDNITVIVLTVHEV